MSITINLPSGLKVNDTWKPTKSEFIDTVGIHYPFNKIHGDKKKEAIEADWKFYSKVLDKHKPKAKAE